jgi:hypothetical protein
MEHLTGRRAQILEWSRSKWAGLALVGVCLRWPRRFPGAGGRTSWLTSGYNFTCRGGFPRGDVLYRDMMYLTGGPLSQYFNALLFKIFGVSFRTLIFANLAITAGMLVLVYRRFLAAADRLTATMICLGIVLVFAFQHYVRFDRQLQLHHAVLPRGVSRAGAFHRGGDAWLSSWVEKERIQFALAAGFGSGLVFLTKPDVFLALAVCVAAAFFVVVFFTNEPVSRQNRWWHSCFPGWSRCWPFLRCSCGWKTGGQCAFGGFGVDAVMAYVHYPGSILSVVPGIGHAVSYLEKMVVHFIFIVGITAIYAWPSGAGWNRVQVDETVLDGLAVAGGARFWFWPWFGIG